MAITPVPVGTFLIPSGLPGVAGDRGLEGPTGPPGANVVVGSVAPADPETGDLWFDTVTTLLFQWLAEGDGQWVVVTNSAAPLVLTAPMGATGATGASGVGATGVTGPSGQRGETGATGVGAVGATGISGRLGTTGLTGATGVRGPAGTVLSTVASSFTIPALGGTVSVSLVDASWVAVGSSVFIGGMIGLVQSRSGNVLTLQRTY